MASDPVERIRANPKYAHLVSTRNRFAFVMTLLMLIVYFGYILLIAYDKAFLAQKIGAGWTMSVGIPMGLGVLIFTIIITVIYVRRANSEFDALNKVIVEEAYK